MTCRITIKGRKTWLDDNNRYGSRPSSLDISLLRDGVVYQTAEISDADNWTYVFDCLPLFKNSSHRYDYELVEPVVPPLYTSRKKGMSFTNILSEISIACTKFWDDENNAFGERPTEITVNLLQNGQFFRTAQVPSPPDVESHTAFSFDHLPLYDDGDVLYRYEIEELSVSGYKTVVDGFDITNVSNHLLFAVAYEANGGTGSFTDADLHKGTVYTVKTLAETGISHAEGFAFLGWNTAADGSGTSYAPDDTLVIDGNVTLYAIWEEVLRSVTGLVSPFVSDDLGHGDAFLRQFDITAELRTSFLTPAPAEMTAVAVLEGGNGRFTISDVPLGNFVLCISRAGHLLRCMNVSITAASPSIVALAPPDGAVFQLVPGDVNADHVVNTTDSDLVSPVLDVSYGDPDYTPAADFGARGRIDSEDLDTVTTNLNRAIADYPGAEDVDFNS